MTLRDAQLLMDEDASFAEHALTPALVSTG
jgi:hypothetical protein